ncbi:hypothetical protein D9M68_746600 [compost metagenome]
MLEDFPQHQRIGLARRFIRATGDIEIFQPTASRQYMIEPTTALAGSDRQAETLSTEVFQGLSHPLEQGRRLAFQGVVMITITAPELIDATHIVEFRVKGRNGLRQTEADNAFDGDIVAPGQPTDTSRDTHGLDYAGYGIHQRAIPIEDQQSIVTHRDAPESSATSRPPALPASVRRHQAG